MGQHLVLKEAAPVRGVHSSDNCQMASRLAQMRAWRSQESSDPYPHEGSSPDRWCGVSQGASRRTYKEVHGGSVREHLREMDQHVARLQDMLRFEKNKCTRLQLRCNQQEAELRRKEQHFNKAKERLTQLTDRSKDRGPFIEVLNNPFRGRGRREHPSRLSRSAAKCEDATLRLMLERREAELREAMKLRHSLTTLLHALRVDMEQTLSSAEDAPKEAQDQEKGLTEAEEALGDHVTGGVVQSWKKVQRRLDDVVSEGQTNVGTDHDKLLAQLESELRETQEIVRLQQQMLQDSLASPLPPELADSYFLEEWDRLRLRWVDLEQQRRAFEKERQSFTDAAIRLSHERRDFEQQRAFHLKHYLCDSPGMKSNSEESSGLNFSGVEPISPSSTRSGTAGIQTPSTPELYAALNLSYCGRSDKQPESWDFRSDAAAQPPALDWSL